MRVIATYIVKGIHGKETILYHSEDGKWFVLNNGALGENDGSLREINPTRAGTLIKYMRA